MGAGCDSSSNVASPQESIATDRPGPEEEEDPAPPIVELGTIDRVVFTYENSLRIPHHFVTVKIRRTYRGGADVHVRSEPWKKSKEWAGTGVNKSLTIGEAEYEKITGSLRRIPRDLNDEVLGLDGATYQLEYGDSRESVSHEVWSPEHNTTQRGLEELLATCKMILKAGGLDPRDVLGVE